MWARPARATTIATTNGSTGLADGTFVGETATNHGARYRCRSPISNGEVTDVTALQTPDSKRKSVQINDYATPILRQEALTAQTRRDRYGLGRDLHERRLCAVAAIGVGHRHAPQAVG